MIELLHDINSGRNKAGEKLNLDKVTEARLIELGVAKDIGKTKKSKETPEKIEGADKAPKSQKETKKEGSKGKGTK